jgi:hypothetical protein
MRSLEGCTAHIVVVVQEYFGKPFLGHNLRLAPVTRVVLEARGAEGDLIIHTVMWQVKLGSRGNRFGSKRTEITVQCRELAPPPLHNPNG